MICREYIKEMNTGAVIIAAGLSSRMGSFKPMLKIGNSSAIRRIISTFSNAGVSPIVLVTGYRGVELEAHISDLDVICLRNANYDTTQMFDSACIGLSFIRDKCRRIFFTLGDIPLFSERTLSELQKADAPLIFPTYHGKKGHPVLISADIVPEIIKNDSDNGLKGAFSKFSDASRFVEVEDNGILYDADTPEEFDRLLELHKKQSEREGNEVL